MRSIESKNFSKHFLKNKNWTQGYKSFHDLLDKPLGWLLLNGKVQEPKRLNRVSCCDIFAKSAQQQKLCTNFLTNLELSSSEESPEDEMQLFTCPEGRRCVSVPLKSRKQNRGKLVLCNITSNGKAKKNALISFRHFVSSCLENVRLADKAANIFEDLQPRALAMSTMHTVHRIISSSLHINDLIPRLGRFMSQVTKSDYGAVFLVDEKRQYFVKRFEVGSFKTKLSITKLNRVRLNKGNFGKMASTGEFFFKDRIIAVPLIEDDVIGFLVVCNERKHPCFSTVDLEILRTVSEQTVIAIKNAQLFEHQEKITSGSVEAIAKLIDRKVNKTRKDTEILRIKLSHMLGAELRITREEKKYLQYAIQLIDAGYLGIPKKIQAKKTPLTSAEYDLIKTHPFHGVELIKSMEPLKPVVPIILYQNERYDGKGYPHGLRGEEIPLCARILALVTAFVAMISERPYRPSKSVEDAMDEITLFFSDPI